MAITTITRTTWTDDDGTGTTGTIINNAQLQAIFDAIDQLFAGSGSYATVDFGGNVRIEGTKGLGLKGIAGASLVVSAAGDATIAYNTTTGRLEQSINGAAYAALTNAPTVSTATGTASITVSGLNLNTDLAYEFLVQHTSIVAGGARTLVAQINGNANADSTWAATYDDSGTNGAASTATDTSIGLSAGLARFNLTSRFTLMLGQGGKPRYLFHTQGESSASSPFVAVGGGIKDDATNVTSIKFALGAADSINWRVIVRRLAS